MADQYPRLLYPVPFLIRDMTLAPAKEQSLIDRKVMPIRIMRDYGISQHDIAGGGVCGNSIRFQITHRKPQWMLFLTPDLDHGILSAYELPCSRAIPQCFLIHVLQERHRFVFIISDDQFGREFRHSALVHG